MIVPDSSVVYEANIMGCHMVSLNLTKRPFVPPLDGASEVPVAYDESSLRNALERMLNELKRSNQSRMPHYDLDGYLRKVDGKSTERVLRIIEDLASGRRLPRPRNCAV